MQDLICTLHGLFQQQMSHYRPYGQGLKISVYHNQMQYMHKLRSIDVWYNAVQVNIPLCEYPPETAAILPKDIFWFFITDNELIAKTINEGNIDLAQYPAAKI